MKAILAILFTLFSCYSYGQDTLRGALYNIETSTPISLPAESDQKVMLVSNDAPGKRKVKFYRVNEKGEFFIPKSDLDSVGDRFDFSVSSFYETNPRYSHNYADFDLTNIPIDKAELYLSKIYIAPAYWTNSCGVDCYVIDNRKTFKRKEFQVVTSDFSYTVKRTPEKIKQSTLEVKYEAVVEEK
jgi:hypothetical protein